jgi:uncharacterized membrane protein
MPITINRNQLFPASCFALLFASVTIVFQAAANSYIDSNSFLKLAIILAILLVIFTGIYFSGKTFYKWREGLNLLSNPAGEL